MTTLPTQPERLHDGNIRRNVTLWLIPAGMAALTVLLVPFLKGGIALSYVALPLCVILAIVSAVILGRNYAVRAARGGRPPRFAILSIAMFLFMISSMQLLIFIVMGWMMFMVLGTRFLPIK